MTAEFIILGLALVGLAAYFAIGLRNGIIVSGLSFAVAHMAASILLVFIPMMERGGHVDVGMPMALLVLSFAVGCVVSAAKTLPVALQDTGLMFRWKYLPGRLWYVLLAAPSFLDFRLTIANYGASSLEIASGAVTGQASAYHETFGPLTYISWAASLAIFISLVLEYLSERRGLLQFAASKWLEIGLVVSTSLLTVGSGSRHQIIIRAVILLVLFFRFRRLRIAPLALGALGVLTFTVIIGNMRLGDVDTRSELREPYADLPMAKGLSWLVLYAEPNLHNLSLYLDNAPEPIWGRSFVTSVLPSGLLNAIGLERDNAMAWISSHNLLAFRGLTLRTMYADLVHDCGFIGAAVLGILILLSHAWLSNSALYSARGLVVFTCMLPIFYSLGGLNGFYQLQNLAVLALPLIFGGRVGSLELREKSAHEQLDHYAKF